MNIPQVDNKAITQDHMINVSFVAKLSCEMISCCT